MSSVLFSAAAHYSDDDDEKPDESEPSELADERLLSSLLPLVSDSELEELTELEDDEDDELENNVSNLVKSQTVSFSALNTPLMMYVV